MCQYACVELKEGVVERDVEKNVECFIIYIIFLYFDFIVFFKLVYFYFFLYKMYM